jgi:hypothetical protein
MTIIEIHRITREDQQQQVGLEMIEMGHQLEDLEVEIH